MWNHLSKFCKMYIPFHSRIVRRDMFRDTEEYKHETTTIRRRHKELCEFGMTHFHTNFIIRATYLNANAKWCGLMSMFMSFEQPVVARRYPQLPHTHTHSHTRRSIEDWAFAKPNNWPNVLKFLGAFRVLRYTIRIRCRAAAADNYIILYCIWFCRQTKFISRKILVLSSNLNGFLFGSVARQCAHCTLTQSTWHSWTNGLRHHDAHLLGEESLTNIQRLETREEKNEHRMDEMRNSMTLF